MIKYDKDKAEEKFLGIGRFTLEDYKKNEDENEHTLNALLLTYQYGTPEEIKEMEEISKRHEASQRGISSEDSKRRYEISNKYYKNLLVDAHPNISQFFPFLGTEANDEGQDIEPLDENEIIPVANPIPEQTMCVLCDDEFDSYNKFLKHLNKKHGDTNPHLRASPNLYALRGKKEIEDFSSNEVVSTSYASEKSIEQSAQDVGISVKEAQDIADYYNEDLQSVVDAGNLHEMVSDYKEKINWLRQEIYGEESLRDIKISNEDYYEDGFNAYGRDSDGYDENGFDKYGFDRRGFNIDGFNRDGFGRDGFDRDGFNKDGFSRWGFDRFGYDRDGFDEHGFDVDGFNKQGYSRDGFDWMGFDLNRFTKDGYISENYNKDDYDEDGYDRFGYDQYGYDRKGFDRFGYDSLGNDRAGYDRFGYDGGGYDREGFDQWGYSYLGFDREGFDREGYDINGFTKDNYINGSYNKDGYNIWGLNKDGYDKDGFHKTSTIRPRKRSGERYDDSMYDDKGYDIDGFDKRGFDKDGYDHFGFNKLGRDKDGFYKDGFNRGGLHKNGTSRDDDGYDWKGYDINGFDRNGYDGDGYDRDGFHRNSAIRPWKRKRSGEGAKRYREMSNVGTAKYTVSFHDGIKKHSDGSDFFDIEIFKNKKEKNKFINDLEGKGYRDEFSIWSRPDKVGEGRTAKLEKNSTSISNLGTMDYLDGKQFILPDGTITKSGSFHTDMLRNAGFDPEVRDFLKEKGALRVKTDNKSGFLNVEAHKPMTEEQLRLILNHIKENRLNPSEDFNLDDFTEGHQVYAQIRNRLGFAREMTGLKLITEEELFQDKEYLELIKDQFDEVNPTNNTNSITIINDEYYHVEKFYDKHSDKYWLVLISVDGRPATKSDLAKIRMTDNSIYRI